MSKKSTGLTRRELLSQSVKGLGLLGISSALSNVIVQSIAESAFAQTTVNSSKKYIYFSFDSGPPRWFFDLPLTPQGTADTFSHTGLGTYVGKSSTTGNAEVFYKTYKDPVSGYHLPPVWGANPKGDAFSELLQHSFFIRGIDYEINNHMISRVRNQAPVVGGYSIAAQLADKSVSPIPAVNAGSIGSAFKSKKGISGVDISYTTSVTTNPIQRVMEYFSGAKPIQDNLTEQSLKEFDRYATNIGLAKNDLTASKNRSDELIKQGVQKFTSLWAPTLKKYEDLIKESMKTTNTSSFMEDVVLTAPFVPESTYMLWTDTAAKNLQIALNKKLKISATDFIKINDLRGMISEATTTIPSLAATFATIEILISQGLTQSFTTSLSGLVSLNKTSTTKFNIQVDQHDTGSLVSTIGTTYYYRAVLSCTDELVRSFKSSNIFKDTVIQFGSEFNRNARVDGSGSDHGYLGGSTLIISGMLNKTSVIGNIKNDKSATYLGWWGLAAPHPATNNKPIRINDVALTVCAMLGVSNVSNNGRMLLRSPDGVSYTSLAGENEQSKNITV